MNNVLLSTTFFGVTISLVTYFFGVFLRKKFNFAIVNPPSSIKYKMNTHFIVTR